MIKIKQNLINLFKKLSYKFFFLLYGKINGYSDYKSFKEIVSKNFEIEDRNYSVFKITESRLYTDRIHNMAVIIKNILIKEASFQLKNNNNSEIQNNIVLKIGTPRKLKKINGNILSLLSGGGGNDNYWHWLFDVLPRVKLSENLIEKQDIDFLLVPEKKRNFQIDTLRELGFSKEKILSSRKFRHIAANCLFITDHPYVKRDTYKEGQNFPLWIIEWLRSQFLNLVNEIKDTPKRIFIDRSDALINNINPRVLINQEEIKNYLKKKDFVPVRLADYSFLNQVKMFSFAEKIVGLHGAGFANMIFCRKNTEVVEFRTEQTGKIIENLAIKSKLNFNYIEKKSINLQSHMQQGSIEIPVKELDRLIS